MNNKSLGFTLIELIVVIAILSILAASTIAALNPFGQFQKAQDSKVKSDLAQIQKALETYYGDKGLYPTNSVDYRIVDVTLGAISWGGSWGTYMNIVPKDPNSGHTYIYYSPNGQTYYIYANLSKGVSDPQVCNSGNACVSLPANVNCGSATVICNYGVSSPNQKP